MPRKYKRKTTRQSWSEENMEKAIKVVIEGNMGYLKAAKTHNVPQSTLEDRVKKTRRGLLVEKASKKVYMGGFRPVFTPDQEQELVDHISIMESRLFGFTMVELRTMAYELAVRNGVGSKFDAKKKMAGKDWLQGFLKRNPKLHSRTWEKTSAPRTTGFNKVAVAHFFHVLEALFEEHKFSPTDIYNVTEIAITTVPNKPSKIIAAKGRKQVGISTSPDHIEALVTTEVCMSAAGSFMPTMFVFPCNRVDSTLLNDALPGSTAEYHETGLMQKDLFVKWFKQFLCFANPSPEKPVLLLLDGEGSHTKNLELINLASENNVILLSFPPNCTHKLQPLDITFITPLSTYYDQEVQEWLSAHPGCWVTMHQVSKLFGSAFMSAAVMGAAINGFKQTGIYPFDPNVFPDHLYAPSNVTDGFIPQSNLMESFSNVHNTPWHSENSGGMATIGTVSPEPSTSRNSCFVTEPENSINAPHEQRKQVENRELQEENILICSPYQFELEKAIAHLTQHQIHSSTRKKKLSDNNPANTIELTKKPQLDNNAIIEITVGGDSSSEKEVNF